MRRIAFFVMLFLLLFQAFITVFAADSTEDFQPINTGMKLNFVYIFEHMEQKDKTWQVQVVKNSFPESLTFTWLKKEKDGTETTGTRIIYNLANSRNFNPWFTKNETKDTVDTAPWLSVQVLTELRDNANAGKFREGGTGAVNWAPTTLTVKDNIIFPVMINGKPEAIHALKLSKGIIVWNNLKNPIVLQYEPLGIPFFTSITGWKLVSIQY
ncbi:MAG TPA: hypothetical protein DDW65_09795 [Firmicutes bacterium]|jgi:hypothetical protein|nr:hypothetical protein [Bacillota bacterium]